MFHNVSRSIYAITLFIMACAQPVTPTGGDKDTSAPEIISISTPSKSTQVKPNKITFFFNENIQIKNPENNIVISPIISPKAKFIKSNKSISILLNSDSLIPNTTYSFSFNDAVSDLNEGNSLRNFTYIFSTGNTLDSHLISGKIIYSDKPKKEVLKLWCFGANKNIKYTAQINNRTFSIPGLDSTSKKIVVFNDENNNNAPDAAEDVGIANDVLPSRDSALVLMYSRKKTTINQFHIGSTSYLTGLPASFIPHYLDSFSCYRINDTLFADSQTINRVKKTLTPSYFIISEINETRPEYISHYHTYNPADKISGLTYLYFNAPILSIDHTRFQFIPSGADSSYKIASNRNVISFLNATGGKGFILPGCITFKNGATNKDTIIFDHSVPDAFIHLKNNEAYTVYGILTNNGRQVNFSIPPAETFSLHVSQGTYEAYYFYDADGNRILNPPVFTDNTIQSGETWQIQKGITANAKLENEIILK